MATAKTDAPLITDYGIFSAETSDIGLRSRVLDTLQQQQEAAAPLDPEQLIELVSYMGQLEDALLRYHWGNMRPHEILTILKFSTGLDIEARADALATMAAADA